jgi:hypothetical protein
VTIDGTMTGLTSVLAQADVAGHHVETTIRLATEIPDVRGVPVQVTMYRGQVAHIEGPGLSIDGWANPTVKAHEQRGLGWDTLVASTLLVGVNLLLVRFKTGRWPGWSSPPSPEPRAAG